MWRSWRFLPELCHPSLPAPALRQSFSYFLAARVKLWRSPFLAFPAWFLTWRCSHNKTRLMNHSVTASASGPHHWRCFCLRLPWSPLVSAIITKKMERTSMVCDVAWTCWGLFVQQFFNKSRTVVNNNRFVQYTICFYVQGLVKHVRLIVLTNAFWMKKTEQNNPQNKLQALSL